MDFTQLKTMDVMAIFETAGGCAGLRDMYAEGVASVNTKVGAIPEDWGGDDAEAALGRISGTARPLDETSTAFDDANRILNRLGIQLKAAQVELVGLISQANAIPAHIDNSGVVIPQLTGNPEVDAARIAAAKALTTQIAALVAKATGFDQEAASQLTGSPSGTGDNGSGGSSSGGSGRSSSTGGGQSSGGGSTSGGSASGGSSQGGQSAGGQSSGGQSAGGQQYGGEGLAGAGQGALSGANAGGSYGGGSYGGGSTAAGGSYGGGSFGGGSTGGGAYGGGAYGGGAYGGGAYGGGAYGGGARGAGLGSANGGSKPASGFGKAAGTATAGGTAAGIAGRGGMMGGFMGGAGMGRGMGADGGGGGAATSRSWLHEDRDPFTTDDAAPPIVGGMPPRSETEESKADA